MDNYKEIVTKAVIGKSRKSLKDNFEIKCDNNVTTVLGCWIINHRFSGVNDNDVVNVNGEYDVNVWYSYDNDTKTDVVKETYSYHDSIKVNLKDTLDSNSEVIIESLKDPTVNEVKVDNNKIVLDIDKELGCEVVGNTKIKVPVKIVDDEYEDISDIDNINDDYLK